MGRQLCLGIAVALWACGPAPGAEAPAPGVERAPAEPEPPRLVVLLVIDQLPSWSFQRDAELVRGGLRRLLERGTYYPEVELPYASTYTAPGHAALGTGAPPARTGILANSWYRRDRGEVLSAVFDPEHGASPRELRVEGLADVLRRESGGRGRSVSVGLKARAAVLMLGRRPDLAVYYDPERGVMTTSSFYAGEPPDWLARLAAEHPASRYFDAVWEPLDAELLSGSTGSRDDGRGEGENYGLGATFPHRIARGDPPARALRATPFGTELTFAAALAALEGEQLGADEVPDLLGLSLASHDYAGHYWGPRSWERLDLFLRLDRSLGQFLEELDRRVGEGAWALVLSSDHGATPMIERSLEAGREARRVDVKAVLGAARRAAQSVLGEGTWVETYAASTIYMSGPFRRLPADRRYRALDAVVRAVRALDGIAYAARTDRVSGDCDRRRGPAAFACRSLHPERSGEVFIGPERYSLVSRYDHGTSHGTMSPEDRRVPLIVYRAGREARAVRERVSFLRIAATVADLLGVSAPPEAPPSPL